MTCPAVRTRQRATQRERMRPERRSTREPSFINEYPASTMSLRSHSIQNAQRQTALLQPSSRAAVDERRVPIRARSSASSLVQPDAPTANAHHCKSHSASALNQPPVHRAAKSTELSPQRGPAASMGDGGTVGCRTPRGAHAVTTNDGRDASCPSESDKFDASCHVRGPCFVTA